MSLQVKVTSLHHVVEMFVQLKLCCPRLLPGFVVCPKYWHYYQRPWSLSADLYSVVVFQYQGMQRKIYLCLRVIQCCKKLLLLTQACRLSIASAVILVKIWISSAYISVATVLRWSEQNYSHLRQVFSWCCVPKIINIGQCFTELFKKITLAQFFETRRISLFALRKAITTA